MNWSDDERYFWSADRYLRGLHWVARKANLDPDREPVPFAEEAYLRVRACRPAGYVVLGRWRVCGAPFCLFCHARRAAASAAALVRAFRRKPPSAPAVYLAPLYCRGRRDLPTVVARKLRLAGACGVAYPLGDSYDWIHAAVLVCDDRGRFVLERKPKRGYSGIFDAAFRPRKAYSPGRVMTLAARFFAYPPRYTRGRTAASGLVRALRDCEYHAKYTRLAWTAGVCRDHDHAPGKALLDWKADDPPG